MRTPTATPRRREVEELVAKLEADDVVVRGVYDLSGLRADADVMVWWHAEDLEQLQDAYHAAPPHRASAAGSTRCGRRSRCTGRPSSTRATSRRSWPTRRPRDYVCVYPFVRSYEWYLLEDSERRRLLAEHGQMAREYPDVRANTVASFALGDYEWMLAFEADELHRIVDLMRHLRGSETRRHVREEVPFYTGRRRTPTELVTALPYSDGTDESDLRGDRERSVMTPSRPCSSGNNVGIDVPEEIVLGFGAGQARAR